MGEPGLRGHGLRRDKAHTLRTLLRCLPSPHAAFGVGLRDILRRLAHAVLLGALLGDLLGGERGAVFDSRRDRVLERHRLSGGDPSPTRQDRDEGEGNDGFESNRIIHVAMLRSG